MSIYSCLSLLNSFICHRLEDSFENEIQAEIDSLDNIPEEESQLMYKGGDHVSCEDLLEFALDKPNTRRYFNFILMEN